MSEDGQRFSSFFLSVLASVSKESGARLAHELGGAESNERNVVAPLAGEIPSIDFAVADIARVSAEVTLPKTAHPSLPSR